MSFKAAVVQAELEYLDREATSRKPVKKSEKRVRKMLI